MAITLYSPSQNVIPSYDLNAIKYSMTSTNSSQSNFKFIVKLYDAITSSLIGTVKLTIDNQLFGNYNPTGLINSYFSGDIPALGVWENSTFYKCTNSYKVVRLEVAEEYGDPIIQYGTGDTSTKYYYNGCKVVNESYISTYWYVQDSASNPLGHFLSPTTEYYLDNDELLYLYFNNYNITGLTIYYTFYDVNSSTLDTITYTTTGLTTLSMYRFPAGPHLLLTGSTPSNWNYYRIDMKDSNGNFLIERTTFVYRKNKCKQYDYTRLYWLNQYGGYSNFTFIKRKYSDYNIQRSTYDKILPLGQSIVYNRGTTQFNTIIENTITLNTDWINPEENKLIKSLMISPDVYMVLDQVGLPGGSPVLYPVNIMDATFSEKNNDDDGLYSYQIKLQMSVKNIVQRG